MLGSWKINVDVNGMPEKVATAVGKLNELVGAEYAPIAYLGSQVVHGINHAVLAEQTLICGKDVKNVVLVIFNEQANAIDLTLVSIERVVEGAPKGVLGGTEVDPKTDIPVDAKAVFAKGIAGFVGSKLEPFALLATQVVSGVNYIYAVEVTPVVENPESKISIITVNNLSGSISFDDILN